MSIKKYADYIAEQQRKLKIIGQINEEMDRPDDHKSYDLHHDSFKDGMKYSSGKSGHIAKHGELHAKETEAGDSSTSDNVVYGVHNKKTGETKGVSISSTIKATPEKVAKALGHGEVGKIHHDIAKHHNSTFGH